MELKEIYERYDEASADTSLSKDERAKKLRQMRKQIRAMGGSTRHRNLIPGEVPETIPGESRKKKKTYFVAAVHVSEEDMEEFSRELRVAFLELGLQEVTEKIAPGTWYSWSGQAAIAEMKVTGLSIEEVAAMMKDKYIYRWKEEPSSFRLMLPEINPLVYIGPVQH